MFLLIDLLHSSFASRMKVLSEGGLGSFEDHPDKILGAAVAKYNKVDPAFPKKYVQLEAENMRVMQKLFQNAPDKDKAIEEFGKSVLEEE